ncbi:MAG TPA: hypothetical protein VJ302_23415 [Blastocatellia bacterium]|nr:hypothetical protein [Blastocatellia bacterium]
MVAGPISDELANEAFLRLLIEDGVDKDWNQRTAYLRWVGLNDEQIEKVKPYLERFKSSIRGLDRQSLTVTTPNVSEPDPTAFAQYRAAVDRIAALKRENVTAAMAAFDAGNAGELIKKHLEQNIIPNSKTFTSGSPSRRTSSLDRRFSSLFSAEAASLRPCRWTVTLTNNTWVDYRTLTIRSLGAASDYSNSCGDRMATLTRIKHGNDIPPANPAQWSLDPGGDYPLLSGQFISETIAYLPGGKPSQQSKLARISSAYNLRGLVSIVDLAPASPLALPPGNQTDLAVEIKSTTDVTGEVKVAVAGESNPAGIPFTTALPQTVSGTLSEGRVKIPITIQPAEKKAGATIFSVGLNGVPARATANGKTMKIEVCYGTVEGGQCH